MLRGSSDGAVWRALAWAPAGAGLLYAVVFLAQAGEIVRALHLNADIASGPVLAHLLPAAPSGREVLLGNYAWYEALWLQRALDELPGRRALLQAVPLALGALTGGLVAGAVRSVTRSWWAAAVAAVVVLAAGATVWACLGTWTVHGLAWVHVAALGAFLAWVVARPRGRAGLVVAGALGLATGVAAASDLLVVVAGLGPLALAAAVGPPRARRPVALCLAAAALGGVAFAALMRAVDVQAAGTLPMRLVEPGGLAENARIVAEALADVVNGRFTGAAAGISTAAHAGAAALAALAAVAIAAWIVRRARGLDAPRRAHVAFWAGGGLALLAATVVSTVPVDATSARYLVGVLLALAALLPLLGAGPRARAAIGAGVALYACVGVMALLRGELTGNPLRAPSPATAAALADLAADERVAVGYAGYWDAMPLTWQADFAVPIHPVRMCDEAGRPCAFEFHRISTWYRPRRGVRSMLVVDREIRALSVTTRDPRLGRPAAVRRVGQLEVAIYDHDIARGFGPPATGIQPGA